MNYKNFFSYIDAGATELNMLQAEDVCKAEASAVSMLLVQSQDQFNHHKPYAG